MSRSCGYDSSELYEEEQKAPKKEVGSQLKLIIFIQSMSSGGAERVTATLSNFWAQKGLNVTVATLASESLDYYELHPDVKRLSIELVKESTSPFSAIFNNLRRIFALRRILRKHKPNVVLAMMSSANVLMTLAAIGLRNVAVVGSERTYPPKFPLGTIWETLRSNLYRRLTSLVAQTQKSAVWLARHTQARNVVVIPNPVAWPLPNFRPRLELTLLPNGQCILLAVGRLSEVKQYRLLILVFKRLSEDFPDWVLVVLGEGPDRKELEDLVQSAGLGNHILLPGRAGNLAEWYEAADIFVMTSLFEGFPNALVEAMSHGCPAVSFDCDTGPRDIIRNEEDGLLVPPGNVDALDGALRRMMSDEKLRLQFAKRAIEVRERFSVEKISAMWETVFKKFKK